MISFLFECAIKYSGTQKKNYNPALLFGSLCLRRFVERFASIIINGKKICKNQSIAIEDVWKKKLKLKNSQWSNWYTEIVIALQRFDRSLFIDLFEIFDDPQ